MAAAGGASEDQGMPFDRREPMTTWEALCLGGFTLSLFGFAPALHVRAEREAAEQEPAWWRQFEDDFARYVRETSEGGTAA